MSKQQTPYVRAHDTIMDTNTFLSQLAAVKKHVKRLEYLVSDFKSFVFNVNPYRKEPKNTLEDECEELEGAIKLMRKELVASQKRERILREGLAVYATSDNWMFGETYGPYENSWRMCDDGFAVARNALKAAEEVK